MFWSTSMPHTRYRNSIPNKDGGACAGAWASTSLPRLRLLVCATALMPLYVSPRPLLQRALAETVYLSSKGNGGGTSGAARENFNTGCAPRDGLDLAAAGRADARRHAGISRRGDVPRASAARSN